MNDDDGILEDRDQAVWETIGACDGNVAELSPKELLTAFDQFAESSVEYQAQNEREHAKLYNRISDVERKADGNFVDERSNTLGKYASMDEENRRELLGTKERLAAAIYEHWDELVESLPHGAIQRGPAELLFLSFSRDVEPPGTRRRTQPPASGRSSPSSSRLSCRPGGGRWYHFGTRLTYLGGPWYQVGTTMEGDRAV